MNKKQYREYLDQISLSLPKSEVYKHWAILGHGRVLASEKQPEEQVMEVIWAPYSEDSNKLNIKESRVAKNMIGGMDLYKRRTTWRSGSEPRGKFYAPNISRGVGCSFLSQSAKLVTLRDVLSQTGKSRFIEKFSDNSAIASLLKSKYIHYEVDSGKRPWSLYVPCSEIVRFYYGSSSGLLKAAFKGGNPEKVLYNPEKTFISDYGIHTVHLRKGIYDVDAPYVGRVAFDSFAKNKFLEIHSHTFTEQGRPENHFPICFPPIQGRLTWKVQGELVNGDVIVTRITQCNGGFPFEHLIFGRDNDNRGIRTRAPDEYIPIKRKRNVLKNTENSNEDENENPSDEPTPPILDGTNSPTIYTDPLILNNIDEPFGESEFTEFQNIKVDKAVKLEIIDQSRQRYIVYEGEQVIEQLSTAAAKHGAHNLDVGKLNILRSYGMHESDDKSATSENVVQMYDVMVLVRQILLGESDKNEVSLEYLFDEKHHISMASTYIPYEVGRKKYDLSFSSTDHRDEFIEGGYKNIRLYRPAQYFYISYKGIAIYLIEIVSNDGLSPVGISTMIFSEKKDIFDDDFAYQQVLLFDNARIQWPKNAKKQGVYARRKTHIKKDDREKVAEKIVKVILDIAEETGDVSS